MKIDSVVVDGSCVVFFAVRVVIEMIPSLEDVAFRGGILLGKAAVTSSGGVAFHLGIEEVVPFGEIIYRHTVRQTGFVLDAECLGSPLRVNVQLVHPGQGKVLQKHAGDRTRSVGRKAPVDEIEAVCKRSRCGKLTGGAVGQIAYGNGKNVRIREIRKAGVVAGIGGIFIVNELEFPAPLRVKRRILVERNGVIHLISRASSVRLGIPVDEGVSLGIGFICR